MGKSLWFIEAKVEEAVERFLGELEERLQALEKKNRIDGTVFDKIIEAALSFEEKTGIKPTRVYLGDKERRELKLYLKASGFRCTHGVSSLIDGMAKVQVLAASHLSVS